MLNEIKKISNSLISAGVNIPSFIPDLRTVSPVSKMFKVEVSINGNIRAYIVSNEVRATYKHVYRDSKSQFLITKIKPNITKSSGDILVSDVPLKMIKDICRKLEQARSTFADMPKNKNTKSFFEFFKRYDSFEDKSIFVLNTLNAIKKIDEKALLEDFFVAYDIDDYYELKCSPINHDKMYMEWESVLNKELENRYKEENISPIKDIFNNSYIPNDRSLPKIVFGSFSMSIFSRNPEMLCTASYGVTGTVSCPLSEKSKTEIHNVLYYLLDKGKRDNYWMSYNCDDGGRILMIVVVAFKENVQDEISQMLYKSFFPSTADKNIINDGDILKQSSEFIGKLKGEYSPAILDNPIIIGIKVPNKGPYNMVYSQEVSKDFMVKMSEEWVNGWGNYKPTFIKVSKDKIIKTDNKITVGSFLKVINKKWNIRGDGKMFSFLSPEEGYDFFFSSKKQLSKCVNIISLNHINLLIDVASRIHNGDKYNLRKERMDVFKIPIMISTLLYKMGIKQDEYEKSSPYLLGKLFSHLDKMQKEYRQNRTSKLVGSDNITLLLNRPSLAVSRAMTKSIYILQKVKTQRCKEYILNGKSSSYYDYHVICEMSKELINRTIPKQWSNLDKILVALGYFLNK